MSTNKRPCISPFITHAVRSVSHFFVADESGTIYEVRNHDNRLIPLCMRPKCVENAIKSMYIASDPARELCSLFVEYDNAVIVWVKVCKNPEPRLVFQTDLILSIAQPNPHTLIVVTEAELVILRVSVNDCAEERHVYASPIGTKVTGALGLNGYNLLFYKPDTLDPVRRIKWDSDDCQGKFETFPELVQKQKLCGVVKCNTSLVIVSAGSLCVYDLNKDDPFAKQKVLDSKDTVKSFHASDNYLVYTNGYQMSAFSSAELSSDVQETPYSRFTGVQDKVKEVFVRGSNWYVRFDDGSVQLHGIRKRRENLGRLDMIGCQLGDHSAMNRMPKMEITIYKLTMDFLASKMKQDNVDRLEINDKSEVSIVFKDYDTRSVVPKRHRMIPFGACNDWIEIDENGCIYDI